MPNVVAFIPFATSLRTIVSPVLKRTLYDQLANAASVLSSFQASALLPFLTCPPSSAVVTNVLLLRYSLNCPSNGFAPTKVLFTPLSTLHFLASSKPMNPALSPSSKSKMISEPLPKAMA